MGRGRERAHQPSVGSSIFDLPRHLLMDILIRLPVRTICDCRCVCTNFRDIISDPDFAQLHLPRSPTTLLLRATPGSVRGYRDLYLVEPFQPYAVDSVFKDHIDVPNNNVAKFNAKSDVPIFELEFLSSCNGLICFYRPRTYDPYYICNPQLNEYVVVPQIERGLFDQRGSGFGFCLKTNQYKVLRFLFPSFSVARPGLLNLETEIITVGTNLWRKVGNAPRFLHWFSSGCFLNGALHWIVHNSDNRFESLCRFDLGDEQFQAFPSPAELVADINSIVDQMHMGLLGNCLSIFHQSSYGQLDVWMMMEYGVEESWTKEFAIELPTPSTNFGQHYNPLMLLNDGAVLVLFTSFLLLSYNKSDGSIREVWIDEVTPYFKAMAYIPSFISPKRVMTGNS